MKRIFTIATLIALGYGIVVAQETPTMGWSSWNTYGFRISESIIKSQATAMVTKGLSKFGYNYINIDDGYFGGRDENGKLLINKERFPNGMKTVVDHIHRLGLKAGIYSDGGRNTCASFHGGDKSGIGVGLYEHDQQDCDLFFKELDFDFIKVDFCGGAAYHNNDGEGGKELILDEKKRYTEIHNAIVNTGKEGVRMNVCRWAYPGTWVTDVATSWRTTGDIYNSWESVKGIIKENLCMSAYCRNGAYNDMDMLEIGRGMTQEEDKTHFAMWCIMSSPLLIGCEVSTIKNATLSLLKNEELIALNQDPLCQQAYVADFHDGCYVLVKDILVANDLKRAFAIYNPTDKTYDFTLDFSKIDLVGKIKLRNIMDKKDEGEFEGTFTVRVPAHGTRVFKAEAEQRLERTLYEAETAYIHDYQELTWPSKGSYDQDDNMSGGYRVGWLGNGEKCGLLYENVYSQTGGTYQMTLAYLSGDNRNMTVNVNGKDVTTLKNLKSGNYDKTVAKRTITIELNKGVNTINLYNKTSDMPNMDYMSLKLITPLPNAIETHKEQSSDKSIYSIKGKKNSTLQKGINIIKDNKGSRKVLVQES